MGNGKLGHASLVNLPEFKVSRSSPHPFHLSDPPHLERDSSLEGHALRSMNNWKRGVSSSYYGSNQS